ncbi:MAG: glutamate-1-semialdehyde 2,1-aminomutase [Chloroflexi bacterium]|nr:glutamate-1-semialdehyde 2,1-aminomutase [Chloroflexota bacterium]
MNIVRSEERFREAQKYMPGGVNSPVRAFRGVGGNPIFLKSGAGSRVYDADGNEYIDYVCSWGPLILGHAHPRVVEALQHAVQKGTTFGAPTELEIELAKLIHSAIPSVELVRFVNSGTEATMSAIRLARAYTGRDKVVKFEGCYHGHADGLLVKAGSGVATLSLPDSPGVPAAYAENTIVAPYNDLATMDELFDVHEGEIAAVIVEPVAGNMGVVPPRPGFLDELRRLTRKAGALLIFDEVITGFRLSYGGAQKLYGVEPDLTCLGKIIGGGLPVGAYGGKKKIMEMVAPLGPVYQAGTLSGNPLAMTAGIETLKLLTDANVYEELEKKSARLADGLASAASRAEIPFHLSRAGSMMTFFFTGGKVIDYTTAKSSDTKKYASFFHEMLKLGVYLPPSQFEAMLLSLAHSDKDIEATVEAAETAFESLS